MDSLITVSDDKIFALSNGRISYIMRVSGEGLLEHIYFGASLSTPFDLQDYQPRTERALTTHFEGVPDYNLSEVPLEYPTFGRSDFRQPALLGRDAAGHGGFTLRYNSHRITEDKPALSTLPSARGGDSETLIITLVDSVAKLRVELFYTLYRDHDALCRSAIIHNDGTQDITLSSAQSSALHLPAGDYDLLHLHGTWAREFNRERLSLPQGCFTIHSARGASSAVHHPFMAVMDKDATERSGNVYGSSLIYSGNFALSVARGEYQDARLLIGINPFDFGWTLTPDARFETPEAVHVFSPEGLGGMSRIWHDFIRAKILPTRFQNTPRPTYLNTWEAAYFDVDEAKVLAIADTALDIGVEMVVLDDGWFKGRTDDRRALGDWTADPTRFPNGIANLAKAVTQKGLKFGLWFEPEMVSPDSDLFRAHPDWVLHIPGREGSTGRNQLTLDLSRPKVCAHIFSQLDGHLSCGDISYVKWDMNRNMTEVGSPALPAHQQCEVPHRYMMGLYGLLAKLMDKYPDVMFETCASGGNRFDLGMLSFMAQGWISDMCDPVGRVDIINGASLLYPLDAMAAYIGPSPNHQNGRISGLETRYIAGAFCAAQGVSLNVADIAADREAITALMKQAGATARERLGGRFNRLQITDNETLWQFSSRDGSTIRLAYFHKLAAPNQPFARAKLVGLDPAARYENTDSGAVYSGDVLMNAGLPLPYVSMSQTNKAVDYMPKGDFSAALITLRKI